MSRGATIRPGRVIRSGVIPAPRREGQGGHGPGPGPPACWGPSPGPTACMLLCATRASPTRALLPGCGVVRVPFRWGVARLTCALAHLSAGHAGVQSFRLLVAPAGVWVPPGAVTAADPGAAEPSAQRSTGAPEGGLCCRMRLDVIHAAVFQACGGGQGRAMPGFLLLRQRA